MESERKAAIWQADHGGACGPTRVGLHHFAASYSSDGWTARTFVTLEIAGSGLEEDLRKLLATRIRRFQLDVRQVGRALQGEAFSRDKAGKAKVRWT